MSGYLEVKYPVKSNLSLKPFKSWKRQWCIVRPSPTRTGGGSLAVYSSEAGAAVGTVELSPSCVVRRAKSRTRPNAFAVFSSGEPRKPRVLLAAPTNHDAQIWMDKIKSVLNGDKILGTEALLKDLYSVSVLPSDLSRKCGLSTDSVVTLSTNGVLLSRAQKLGAFIEWQYVLDVQYVADKNRTCIITVNSNYPNGGGEIKLTSPLANELTTALQRAVNLRTVPIGTKKLSKSDGDLYSLQYNDLEPRRRSWYYRPSEISLDDTDLIMSKELKRLGSGQLSRCSATHSLIHQQPLSTTSLDDSMSDRRSLLSVASGIYEEIPDLPDQPDKCETDAGYYSMSRQTELTRQGPNHCAMSSNSDPTNSFVEFEDRRAGAGGDVEMEGTAPYCSAAPGAEPTYESVAECVGVYATVRRGWRCPLPHQPPPPLPPRLHYGTMKTGKTWNSVMNKPDVTRHSSLGSLPRCSPCSPCSTPGDPGDAHRSGTLPKPDKKAFSVFRKRLKSDSRINNSPKSETKENTDTKKKKFDLASFKNFKVGRKMKKLQITNLAKVGETKSCEFLDETEHVTANRCSKSVECLDDDGTDLSLEFNDDAVSALALPQEIVDLILRSHEQINKVRLKEPQMSLPLQLECDYMPMSPITSPPIDHYIVMSPRTNLA